MILPPVIGIAGRKRHGKDSLGAHFVAQHGYVQRSFAGLLKRMALAIDPVVTFLLGPEGEAREVRLSEIIDRHGWEVAKEIYPETRRILQRLGTDGGRMILGEDVWVEAAKRERPAGEATVYTDVRFPNEVRTVRDMGGIVVRVVRDPAPPVEADLAKHVSETALDHLYLPVVYNNGTLDDLAVHGNNVVLRELLA